MSTTTSGTPRTDEARYCDEQMAFIVDAAFAQQLERELTHAHAQLHALRLVCGTTDANKFQTVVDRQLVELAQAKAYSQQVVVNITEEMNGLKAGNARLLRELEGLRGLKPLLKRARDELKECIEGQDENPDMGSPRTTDEQRAVLNDLDAAMEAGK
jgi:hypothetical protein